MQGETPRRPPNLIKIESDVNQQFFEQIFVARPRWSDHKAHSQRMTPAGRQGVW
jgi:hypothetical protein